MEGPKPFLSRLGHAQVTRLGVTRLAVDIQVGGTSVVGRRMNSTLLWSVLFSRLKGCPKTFSNGAAKFRMQLIEYGCFWGLHTPKEKPSTPATKYPLLKEAEQGGN